ncbi:hypothetical protein L195_g001098 [Trifolium pratense]|uniref:Uncharacterized protein n=1 Tax=Trifolium pratense TaxID=57577 RepID=A0A2K3NNR1_TRIPR|nr:hypothetical protein L195_g001098 [Trifolium pratense]
MLAEKMWLGLPSVGVIMLFLCRFAISCCLGGGSGLSGMCGNQSDCGVAWIACCKVVLGI